MIQLQVEEYCHGCPKFTPVLGTVLITYSMKAVNTPVVCKHAEECKVIAGYVEKKFKVEAIFEKETE